jgi:SAM-dependent methyltransferase
MNDQYKRGPAPADKSKPLMTHDTLGVGRIVIDYFSSKLSSFNRTRFYSGTPAPNEFDEIINNLETAVVSESIPLDKTFRVLDIGAGGGRWSLALVDKVKAITAIEPSEAFEVLSARLAPFKNTRCLHQSFEEFWDESAYDLIIISGVLMYIFNPDHLKKFLSKATGLLKTSGYLVLREPVVGRGLLLRVDNEHKRRATVEEIRKCRYLEIIRQKSYYTAICRDLNLCEVSAFASHIPIFKSNIFRSNLLWNLQLKLQRRFFRPVNFRYIKAWNKILRRPSFWLIQLLNKQCIALFIFRSRETNKKS